MKTKPFDLQAALAGKPWGTRDGRKGVFLSHDPSGTESCRVVCRFEGITFPTTRYEDGRLAFGKDNPEDLVMFAEKRTVYVNLYENHTCSWWHNTKEAAENAAKTNNNALSIAVSVEIEK